METNLANKGIQQGSDAYTAALRDFGMDRNNAYDQMLLQGRQQAATEALQNRNQPLNEISALMSGSQVSMPNWTNTPQTNVAGTNVGGIYNDAYNNQLAGWNASQSQKNAMIGGLFGVAGAAAGSPFVQKKLFA